MPRGVLRHRTAKIERDVPLCVVAWLIVQRPPSSRQSIAALALAAVRRLVLRPEDLLPGGCFFRLPTRSEPILENHDIRRTIGEHPAGRERQYEEDEDCGSRQTIAPASKLARPVFPARGLSYCKRRRCTVNEKEKRFPAVAARWARVGTALPGRSTALYLPMSIRATIGRTTVNASHRNSL